MKEQEIEILKEKAAKYDSIYKDYLENANDTKMQRVLFWLVTKLFLFKVIRPIKGGDYCFIKVNLFNPITHIIIILMSLIQALTLNFYENIKDGYNQCRKFSDF